MLGHNRKMSGAECLADMLKGYGVTHVFHVPAVLRKTFAVMESRTDLFASTLALYWPADCTYRISGYPPEKSFTLALESVNTLITPWLSFLLIWAIVKSKPYRYPLQLVIATYTFYGTLLYYLVAHISGYAVFAYHGTYPYVMFYLANLPWFAAPVTATISVL